MTAMRWAIGVLLLVTAACKSPVRLYDGPAQDRSAVVWIKPTELQIHSVDGRKVDLEAQIDRDPVEVLPGPRTVRVEWAYHSTSAPGLPIYPSTNRTVRQQREGLVERSRRYYKDIRIDAKPGETYEAVWLPVEGQEQREPGLRKVKG